MTAVRQLTLVELGATRAQTIPEGSNKPACLVQEVRLHRDLDAVEPIWRHLEADAVMTPHQSFDFLAAWLRHVAPHEGVQPLVATGHDRSGEAIVLLPLGLRQRHPLRCAEYLGGEHANYNMPLFSRQAFPQLGPADLGSMLEHLWTTARLDLFDLKRQPEIWAGTPNPFLLPASQASPSFAYSGALDRPFEELYRLRVSSSSRAKDRKKLRHLEAAGAVRFFRAETADERRQVLDAFFVQKASRFAAQGIPNIFEDPGAHAFLEEACAVHGGTAALDLHALSVGGKIIATLGVAVRHSRASAMFNSIADGPLERESPGIALMHAVIADALSRGCTAIDFGVGAASYKGRFCIDTDRLLDGFLGISPIGRLAAAAIGAKFRVKRRIKEAPWLWALMEGARRQRSSSLPSREAEQD